MAIGRSLGILAAVFVVLLPVPTWAECRGMAIYAHRGHPAQPENSESAVKRAMSGEWDGVEIDIQRLGDGVWVLNHDLVLGRTTSLARKLARELDSAMWREIRVKDRAGRVSSEPAPFLDKALGSIADVENKVVNAEIKQPFSGCEAVNSAIAAFAEGRPSGQWFLTSLDRRHLTCARRVDPSGYLGLIVVDPKSVARSAARGGAVAGRYQERAAREAAERLASPRLDAVWLQQLLKDVKAPVGVHIDAQLLARDGSILQVAAKLGVALFTFDLLGDADHARALKVVERNVGHLPSGVIIDGDPGRFCGLIGGAH